jgi:hypothetical protein
LPDESSKKAREFWGIRVCDCRCHDQIHSPEEVAALMKISVKSVYRLFADEPGVVLLGHEEKMHVRRKRSLRVPHSVLVRVLKRMTKQ